MSLLGLASVPAELAHKTVSGCRGSTRENRSEIPFYLDQLEELVHADQLKQILDGGLQATGDTLDQVCHNLLRIWSENTAVVQLRTPPDTKLGSLSVPLV